MLKPLLEVGFETNILVPTPSDKVKIMLEKAVDFMVNTKDRSHGIHHIYNLLKSANRFFRGTRNLFPMDKEILLLAIYWHDVWKSQNTPAPWNYLFHQLYEGWGSMFMFKKYARTVDLSLGINRAVSYAIQKHSAFQLRPAKTLEAQLLWDIDTLDVWNVQRVQSLFKNLKWTNISILDSYLLYMKNIGFHLNFEWTKNEVKNRKRFFFEAMAKFRESLANGNQQSEPLFVQSQALSSKLYNLRSIQSLAEFDEKS